MRYSINSCVNVTGSHQMHYGIVKNFPSSLPSTIKVISTKKSQLPVKNGGYVKKVYQGASGDKIQLYRNNKAWLNQLVHTEFIKDFSKEIAEKKPGKKVLLILDNFSGHKIDYEQFSNVEVRFLRPNMTPYVQPLDQAFFSIVKEKFRKWRRHYLVDMEDDESVIPKWEVIRKIFYFLNNVSHSNIRGLWVRAKIIDESGDAEEMAALREQEENLQDYDFQNLLDAQPPPEEPPTPNALPPPPPEWLAPSAEVLLSPESPASLPRPSPSVFPPTPSRNNFITVPTYNPFFRPVFVQITPERPAKKAARILF